MMNKLSVSMVRQMFVVVARDGATEQMLEFAALLALRGPLRVLDGGNCFNVNTVARHLRRMTTRVEESLGRILISRGFTCYELVTLVEGAPGDGIPTLLPGFLSTFYDEDVKLEESLRLLALCTRHLRQLSLTQPVTVGTRPPLQHSSDRMALLEKLLDAADRVVSLEVTPRVERQMRLPF